MIFLSSHELPIHNFIALIPYKPVERFNDPLQIHTLGNRLRPILTLGTSIVVIGAFENEAETLWYEANIAGFTPTQKIKSKLSKAVVLAHIVHRTTPTIESIVQRFCPCRFHRATTNTL
jgi:hypothetical protein